MAATNGMMDHQVEDLRERMRLLQQDRRANIDLLESTKLNNADEIHTLHEENKDLRVRLNHVHKSLSNSRSNGHELENIRKEVLHRRTEYDSLKVVSNKNGKDMKRLRDEVKTCELEARRPSQEDGPVSRQIRALENRLDKAMIKYNEAQSIRSTYEHIVKRLKEERVSFDNQLTALEKTLQAKRRDHDELLLLSSDANHTLEVARHELHRARRDYDDQRVRRDGEVRERQQIVRVRRQMVERKEQRREKRKALVDNQLAEDNVDSAGKDAARSCMSPPATAGIICTVDEEITQQQEESKIDIYENAFRKIKEATGVSDVNEVIHKIIGQESTADSLVNLTKKNQIRVEELTRSRNELKKGVEDVKYSASGNPQRKKAVDEKEEQLALSISDLERSKNKYERVASSLISLKAGVKHLQDKVETMRKKLKGESITLTDRSIGDVLWAAGDVLVEVVARIREQEISEEIDVTKLDGRPSMELLPPFPQEYALDCVEEEELQGSRPYNQRVIFPSVDDDFFDNESNYDDGYGDVDEDELSRDRVKKASSQIIQAQERKRIRARV